MMTRREFQLAALAAATTSALRPFDAFAQAQPLEQVKILYGFPAGSAGDGVARRVAEKLAGTAYTKNAAVVDNKPGAGGRIALELLKAAPTDGSVLAMTPASGTAIYPLIYKKLSYDPFKDFLPVSMSAIIHHGLAVGPAVPASVKNLRDFIAWVKANPAQASYGSPAPGSLPHFIGALIGLNEKFDFKHIPYRGSAPGVADLLGGNLPAMCTPSGDFLQHHKAGRLRVLATSGNARSPFFPDVATFAEQGMADLTAEEWFAFYAPARTPANVIAAASAAINAALTDRAIVDSIGQLGLIAKGSTPDELARAQKESHDRWEAPIKRIGFTADS